MGPEGALLAVLLTAAPGGGAPGPASPEPCEIEGVPGPARCARVVVPEVRGRARGRTIELRVVVASATGESPVPDPVFFLPGGPGAGAVRAAGSIAAEWERARRDRDLVFVDPRGTGGSAPLPCAVDDPRAFLGSVFPLEVVGRCRARLAEGASLEAYHSEAVARDLEAAREALGYDRINLHGVSHGTRVALVYLGLFPDRVRALVLDGATPFRPGAAATFGPDLEEALHRLFDDCAADPPCRRSHPDPAGDLATVLESLEDPGRIVALEGAPPDAGGRVRFSRGDFVYAVRGMMYGETALSLPALLQEAAATGILGPFARAYLRRAEGVWRSLQMGQHLSVFCREDVPPATEVRRVAAAGPGAGPFGDVRLGRELEDDYRAACRAWGVPPAEPDPGWTRSRSTPALVLSGRRDPVTPPHRAARAVAHLPRARHVVFPRGGHRWSGGDDRGCRSGLVRSFLERPDPDALDTSCVGRIRAEPFEVREPGGS